MGLQVQGEDCLAVLCLLQNAAAYHVCDPCSIDSGLPLWLTIFVSSNKSHGYDDDDDDCKSLCCRRVYLETRGYLLRRRLFCGLVGVGARGRCTWVVDFSGLGLRVCLNFAAVYPSNGLNPTRGVSCLGSGWRLTCGGRELDLRTVQQDRSACEQKPDVSLEQLQCKRVGVFRKA